MKKLKIKIPVILPQVPDEKDACVNRLIDKLKGREGIDNVHVSDEKANGVPQLCFHYDPDVISTQGEKGVPLLLDCLTLWTMNLLSAGHDHHQEVKRLLDTLERIAGPVVMVSNEIGLGVIPETELSRLFVDLQGDINQAVAKVSDHVIFVAAGLPIMMKN